MAGTPSLSVYLILVFRGVEGLLGLLLLYVAYFLYEDEENKIQDRLTKLLLGLQEEHSDPSSMNRYLRRCAILSHVALTRIFGQRIISSRAIGISFSYSIASYLLLMPFPHADPRVFVWIVFCILASVLTAMYPNRYTSAIAWALPSSYLALHLAALFQMPVDATHWLTSSITFLSAILCACALDFLWIALNREFIRLAVERNWIVPMVTGLLVSGAVFAIGFFSFPRQPFPDYAYNSMGLYNFLLFIAVLLSTRLFVVFAAGVFLLSMIAGLLYWCVRPFLTRAIYSAHRHSLIREHKILGTVGWALLGDAVTRSAWIDVLSALINHWKH